jgi:lipoate-protein ligase A
VRRILLVVYGGGDAYTQMALDEAALMYSGATGVGIARLYWFSPSAVSIGYFQRLTEAVDLEEARRLGLDVVRRLSGGGSVYHDSEAELVYSITVPLEWLEGVDVPGSFRLLSSWVYRGLEAVGAKPEYSGLNDILVEGRKVSGNAQARRYNAVLQHGTILLEARLDVMTRVLRVPRGKGRSIASRVAGLRDLGIRVSRKGLIEALVSAARVLGEALSARVEQVEGLPRWVLEAGEALRWRYASREWLEARR